MTVIENESHGVMADWIDRRYLNIFLARLQNSLSRAMTFDFGRRRKDTEVFKREVERFPVVLLHDKQARCLAELDLDGSGAHQILSPNIARDRPRSLTAT